MFNKGICHRRPNYYANWAWEAENAGFSKQANRVIFCPGGSELSCSIPSNPLLLNRVFFQIFEKGLAMMATEDDKNELETKQKQFQTR
jgi:hypothetical protein